MTEHDCEDFRVTNCDGTTHTHFCSVCGEYLGETQCNDAGTW